MKTLGRPRCPFCQTVLAQIGAADRISDSLGYECRACGVVFASTGTSPARPGEKNRDTSPDSTPDD